MLKYFYQFGTIAKHIRSEKEFKQCIFNKDLLSLKLSQAQISAYPWYNKYSVFFSLSHTDIERNSLLMNKFAGDYNNIEELAICLQWISVLTHKIRKDIIHPQCYSDLISKYYSYFRVDLSKQSHIRGRSHSLAINPKLSLQNILIKSFICKDDYNTLNFIKQKQIYLLQVISKLKHINKDTFMRLVNPDVFNISDLSFVQMYFFNQLFPAIVNIQSIHEAQKILIYLSNFSILPVVFPKILLSQLKYLMNSDQTLNLQNILQIGNCLYLLTYKFNKILKQSGELANYELFILQLQQKLISWENNREAIGNVIKDNILVQQLISITKGREVKRLLAITDNYQLQLQKVKLQNQYSVDQCLIRELAKITSQSSLSFLQQKVEKYIRIKFTRLIMALSYLCGPALVNTAYRYFQNEETHNFLKQNPYMPDLIKSMQLTIERLNTLALPFNTKQLNNQINNYVYEYRAKISSYLNKQITQDLNMPNFKNQNTIFSAILYETKHQQIFSKASSPIQDLQRIFYYNYNFEESKLNLLRLLKNDQGFIASLIKWNYNRYIAQVYLKQFNCMKQYLNYWQYPHYFAFKVQSYQKQSLKVLVKNMYNQNQLIPPQQNDHIYVNESGNLQGITRSLNRLLL